MFGFSDIKKIFICIFYCFLLVGCSLNSSNLSPPLVANTISKQKKAFTSPKSLSSLPKEGVSSKMVLPKITTKLFIPLSFSREGVPTTLNDKVQVFIDYYTKNQEGRLWFEKVLARAKYYKPLMEKILAEAGLPEELFYLALIESGFNNHAYSPAHACGPWQFIASTARHYHLKIDYWVDERKDPELATRAAALYLKTLYNKFNDWYLTAAAYNAGGGTIQRLLRKYKVNDYWNLSEKANELKLEAKRYVPKWLAVIIVTENAKAYGFSTEQKDKFDCDKVKTSSLTDLFSLSKKTKINLAELKRLNPALKGSFVPPYPYFLRVPKGKKKIVLAFFQIQIEKPISSTQFYTYKVKSGDTLWAIAKKNQKHVGFIAKVNGLSSPYCIKPGQKLLIPYTWPQTRLYAQRDKKIESFKTIYTVKSGDTLWDIARLFNISVEVLKRANKVKGLIHPGDQLFIPLSQKIIVYEVKKGDTLWDIAKKFKTTPKNIRSLNEFSSSFIKPGDELRIKIEG
jgi:membrane-bound lytic murein transglycosylase D